MERSPDRSRIVGRLERLVAANSENPPGRELEAARYLAEVLSQIGLTVDLQEIADGRPNVIATLENGAGPVFAFNSHIDVVPAATGWTSDPFKLRSKDGRLFGRGACDAKGPIAGMLEAIEMLYAARDQWCGTLVAVFVVDEEVASRGARAYVAGRPKIDLCVVGEPTSNSVVIAHKGSLRPVVRVKGITAHSASPDLGVNPLYKAAVLLQMIENRHRALASKSHPLLGSGSLTVTRLNGGHADNVTPEFCDLLLDRRMIPGESEADVCVQVETMLAEAKRDHGIDAEVVEYRATTGGATETSADHIVVAAAVHAVEKHGVHDTALHGLQGACDLVHFRSVGAQGVVLGPGSIGVAHKPDEFVPENELMQSSLIYFDSALKLLHANGATK